MTRQLETALQIERDRLYGLRREAVELRTRLARVEGEIAIAESRCRNYEMQLRAQSQGGGRA